MSNDGKSRPIEAEFREYVHDNLPRQEHNDTYWFTGLVQNEIVREHLAFCEAEYQPVDGMPDEFRDTKYAQDIVRKYGTHAGTRALQSGNMGQLNYFSGLVGYEKDVSGMKVLMSLMQMIEDIPVFICYIFGIMGSGKTDFAMLLLQVFESIYGESNVFRAANVTSDDLDEEIDHYSRIVELLEHRRERIQAGEDLDEFILLVDEAAQIFTGTGSDQHKAKQLAKLLKLARKAKANIILIGQDGKDIDASLRALTTAFVHKESEKKATFYRDVKNREGLGEMMSLSGIPPTDIDYSTWDEGDFVFDADDADTDEEVTMDDLEELEKEHEREMMAILDASTELTQPEIGELYGVSDKTVRRAKRKHQDKLEDLGLDED